MKTLSARVLDPRHLELVEPLPANSGEWVEIVLPETDAELADWRQAARDHFLGAYDGQDAIYDEV